MPKPHAGETRQGYLSRFMRKTESENRPRKQRLAIAYSYWRKYLASRR